MPCPPSANPRTGHFSDRYRISGQTQANCQYVDHDVRSNCHRRRRRRRRRPEFVAHARALDVCMRPPSTSRRHHARLAVTAKPLARRVRTSPAASRGTACWTTQPPHRYIASSCARRGAHPPRARAARLAARSAGPAAARSPVAALRRRTDPPPATHLLPGALIALACEFARAFREHHDLHDPDPAPRNSSPGEALCGEVEVAGDRAAAARRTAARRLPARPPRPTHLTADPTCLPSTSGPPTFCPRDASAT